MKKILYIEDEADQVMMLETRLESFGYDCLTALDGEEGYRLACEEQPDLIILDILMPKMNGYELTYSLKNNEATKRIPIIVVTASGAKALEKKCLELGVEEIIHKPYDSIYLSERIAQYLEG